MWYEEENQFVRAPTPKTFDQLVERLENDDSVLFESISLPKGNLANLISAANQKNEDKERKEMNSSQKINIENDEKEQFADQLSDDFIELEIDDDYGKNDEIVNNESDKREIINQLKDKLRKLELEGDRKLEIIRNKDQQILVLERQLAEIKARLNGETTKLKKTQESVEFYKNQYESALLQLDNLKKSLKKDGKIKRVSARSARPITPKFSV